MTLDAPTATGVVRAAPAADQSSYVDWPAIIGGVVLATAISLVMLAFGSAIGLSFTNFNASPDVSPVWIAIAAASWLLWVQVSSFLAGGYLTGRMRRRVHDATEHESDVRDGAHGLLVWAGGTIVAAFIVASGAGAAVTALGSAASTATIAASNVADDAAETLDPNAYIVDTLYRPGPNAAGTTVVQDTTAAREEAGRIFAAVADGEISAEDKAYLTQSVMANAGIEEEAAAARVDQAVTAFNEARAEAAAAAETARRTAVISAFIIAASLLVSAAGAYWAAQTGGNHRDKQVAFVSVFRRY